MDIEYDTKMRSLLAQNDKVVGMFYVRQEGVATGPDDYGLLQAFTKMKNKRNPIHLLLSLDPNLKNNSLGITVMKEFHHSFADILGIFVDVPFTVNVDNLTQSGMN